MDILQNLDIGTVITIILAAVTAFAGGFWLKAKGKLKQLVTLLFDVYELLSEVEKSLGDNKVTPEEIEGIKLKIADVKAAAKALISKAK
jgi:hypothetical protein